MVESYDEYIEDIEVNDLPSHFDMLDKDKQDQLLEWIDTRLSKRLTINYKERTSYGLKHYYEHETDHYITNAQFKAAMLKREFKHSKGLNWHFNIRTLKGKAPFDLIKGRAKIVKSMSEEELADAIDEDLLLKLLELKMKKQYSK